MPEAARNMEDRLLYRRYLMALERYGSPEQEEPSPGHAVRHCTHCGKAAIFKLDPEGTWYECSVCGEYA
jgi:hypothetical protein